MARRLRALKHICIYYRQVAQDQLARVSRVCARALGRKAEPSFFAFRFCLVSALFPWLRKHKRELSTRSLGPTVGHSTSRNITPHNRQHGIGIKEDRRLPGVRRPRRQHAVPPAPAGPCFGTDPHHALPFQSARGSSRRRRYRTRGRLRPRKLVGRGVQWRILAHVDLVPQHSARAQDQSECAIESASLDPLY